MAIAFIVDWNHSFHSIRCKPIDWLHHAIFFYIFLRYVRVTTVLHRRWEWKWTVIYQEKVRNFARQVSSHTLLFRVECNDEYVGERISSSYLLYSKVHVHNVERRNRWITFISLPIYWHSSCCRTSTITLFTLCLHTYISSIIKQKKTDEGFTHMHACIWANVKVDESTKKAKLEMNKWKKLTFLWN